MEGIIYLQMPHKALLIVIACPGFVLALAAVVYLTLPSMRAQRILAKVESLQIGKSTFSEAQQIAEQVEAKQTGACSSAECKWVSGVTNVAVPDWWRGQGEIFIVHIHVKDGLVDRKDLQYFIGLGSIMSAVSVTEKLDWPEDPKKLRSTKTEGTQGQHFMVHIRMTPSDSADTRKQYTSFNWNCFWQYHGCKDEHELMPTGDW